MIRTNQPSKEMNSPSSPSFEIKSPQSGPSARPWWRNPWIIAACVVLALCGATAAATAWWVKRNVYAGNFDPVTLSVSEKAAFDQKVEQIKSALPAENPAAAAPVDPDVQKRTLTVTEKEVNAWLAQQGLGDQVQVSLGQGKASAAVIAPIDPEVPLLGGKSFRFQVALHAGGAPGDKFSLAVDDVSIGGVPIPNAWLGGIKGVNVLASTAGTDPVVRGFLEGIKEFEIKDGAIRVLLNK